MPKAKTRIRYRYRDRPASHYFSLDAIKRIKDGLWSVGTILAVLWVVAGPFVKSQAGDYLKGQLIEIGMDPATIQTLNKNLVDLQSQMQARDDATKKLSTDVSDLKSLLGTVLELQKLQAIKGAPPVDESAK